MQSSTKPPEIKPYVKLQYKSKCGIESPSLPPHSLPTPSPPTVPVPTKMTSCITSLPLLQTNVWSTSIDMTLGLDRRQVWVGGARGQGWIGCFPCTVLYCTVFVADLRYIIQLHKGKIPNLLNHGINKVFWLGLLCRSLVRALQQAITGIQWGVTVKQQQQ